MDTPLRKHISANKVHHLSINILRRADFDPDLRNAGKWTTPEAMLCHFDQTIKIAQNATMVSVDRQSPINKHTKMAFKFVVFCAALAYANAGLIPAAAPVAYSAAADVSHSYISSPVAVAHAAPLAIHAPAVGSSQQNVIRSYGGNAAISTYSKAVDSAFSSVRKYDTRITNDGLHLAPVATYAHAAPVATYAAPVATYAHAAPVATYAHAGPIATYTNAGPIATYAHAAPVATYAHAAPVVAKAAVAYSPSVAVSHMTFSGLGVNYAW